MKSIYARLAGALGALAGLGVWFIIFDAFRGRLSETALAELAESTEALVLFSTSALGACGFVGLAASRLVVALEEQRATKQN